MNVYLAAAGVLFVVMNVAFLVALVVEDNSIVDTVYGLAFVLSCWSAYLLFGGGHPRQLLALGMVTAWGGRLAVHVALRKRRKGEDFRYRKWREEWGKTFVWRSYLQIFMLQGGVVFLVSLPVLLVVDAPGPPLGLLDLFGLIVWSFGFVFEAVADWQLLRFKRDPASGGRIMQSGLWRLTRHPNYFGEAILWWGVLLVALSTPFGWLGVVSPLLIAFLLLKVSGIPMLEAKYDGNREFELYKERTNAFFPWRPRKG